MLIAARAVLLWSTLAACLPAVGQTKPQEYPTRPVTIVVGFSAGSTNDASARAMAARLAEGFGQQFLVVNREGAAGALSGQTVAKAKPDGYTLLWASSATLVTGPAFNGTTLYDPINDFSPVSVVLYLPYVVVAHPSVPASDVRSLIELARRHPDKLAYASTGVGGTLHLAFELMQHMGKMKMVHVPYRGTPTVIVDLLTGQVQLAVMSVNLVVPHLKTGRMRSIGVTSIERTALLPHVPTISESGLPGYNVTGWYGIVAPARTPAAVIGVLHREFTRALDHPEVKALIAREGARAGGEPPEHFSRFLRTEGEAYRKLIADANLKKGS